MPHGNTGIGHLSTYQRLHLVDVLDAVIDEEHLSVTAHLEINGFPDDVRVEPFHLCLHRIAVRWRSRDARQVSCAHQRELQGTGYRRSGHGEGVDIRLQLSQLLLRGDTKLLLLVDNQET